MSGSNTKQVFWLVSFRFILICAWNAVQLSGLISEDTNMRLDHQFRFVPGHNWMSPADRFDQVLVSGNFGIQIADYNEG